MFPSYCAKIYLLLCHEGENCSSQTWHFPGGGLARMLKDNSVVLTLICRFCFSVSCLVMNLPIHRDLRSSTTLGFLPFDAALRWFVARRTFRSPPHWVGRRHVIFSGHLWPWHLHLKAYIPLKPYFYRKPSKRSVGWKVSGSDCLYQSEWWLWFRLESG